MSIAERARPSTRIPIEKQDFLCMPEEAGEFVVSTEEQIQNLLSDNVLLELRDAYQGTFGVHPDAEPSLEIIRAAKRAGINEVTAGIITAQDMFVDRETRKLLSMIRQDPELSSMITSYAIPATQMGIDVAEDLLANVNPGLEIKVFVPLSTERMEVHEWEYADIAGKARYAMERIHLKFPNTRITSVIEQATQAAQKDIYGMIDMSVEAGASRVCLADTLSFFDEEASFAFIVDLRKYAYTQMLKHAEAGNSLLADRYAKLRFEYHNHNDRGEDRGEADKAASGAGRAGAIRHCTPRGIGERTGNASIDGTYRCDNDFLEMHGFPRVKPEEDIVALDELFIRTTGVNPADYGPEGENKNTSGAALHGDYIVKVWEKLQVAKEELERAQSEFTCDEDSLIRYRANVQKYERLYREGYLPRKEGAAHIFRPNAYSNEDVVRLMFYQLSGISPKEMDPKHVARVEYVLDVVRRRNRPLTPLEMEQLFGVKVADYPFGEYPWEQVDKTHPEYTKTLFQANSAEANSEPK